VQLLKLSNKQVTSQVRVAKPQRKRLIAPRAFQEVLTTVLVVNTLMLHIPGADVLPHILRDNFWFPQIRLWVIRVELRVPGDRLLVGTDPWNQAPLSEQHLPARFRSSLPSHLL